MSDDVKESSGLPESASGAEQESLVQDEQAGGEQNQVDYFSYKKSVDREKKAVERARALEEENERMKQAQLEKEGKLSELVDSLRTENQKLKSQTKQVVGNFAYKSVKSQLETEAAKVGCLNPNALARLVDLENFDVDTDTFEANADQLRGAIDKVRKEVPGLFGKSSPAINNSNPSIEAQQPKKTEEKKLGNMSEEELLKAWEKQF